MSVLNLDIFKDGLGENIEKEDILELYEKLNDFNKTVYDFVIEYHRYTYKIRDYGTGIYLSMLEAHVITDIGSSPGITASELAKKWDKTPAAISQTIRKLEEEGVVRREISKENRRFYNLYLTDKGKEFDYAHKKYDVHSIVKTNMELLKKFTKEDIELSRRFMKEYSNIISEE